MNKGGLLELHGVVAVAAHRNFRAAAAELGLSPSALSHAISSLEQRLGVRLFNRTTRSVSLTEAGREFVDRVRPALSDLSDAMEITNKFRQKPRGTLRLNTSEGSARLFLMPVVARFIAAYPDMHVDIITDGKLVDIVAGGFDAGIRLFETVPQDMIAIPCGPPEQFVIVASPEYLEKCGKPIPKNPADLAAHACLRLRLPSGKIYRWEFEKRDQQIEIDVTGPITLDSSNMIVEAAIAGCGIAYVTRHQAAPYLQSGELTQMMHDWTPPFPGLCLYYPGHRHVPAGLRAFIDVLKASVSTEPETPAPYTGIASR